MFQDFFYKLRDFGIPVRPTDFIRLQGALAEGLILNLQDFYVVARSVLIKSEKHFDKYDRIFAHHFQGADLDEAFADELGMDIEEMLAKWLQDPQNFPGLTDEEREALKKMDPDELMKYFQDRLKDQTKRHDGGNRWIGTGGRSPVGHGGFFPGGMRVGGSPGSRSAVKVAMDRRYIDYSDGGMLTPEKIGEALEKLKHMKRRGPKDQLNIDKTIRETVRQGGEIELVFDRRLVDKLKIMLFLDNGGWSMTPYVPMTRSLFTLARSQFKDVRFFYFHNCIYDVVWEDPMRYHKPVKMADILRREPETRVIIVGDASMSPFELNHTRGAIDYGSLQTTSGLSWLRRIKQTFAHTVWINPMPAEEWDYSYGSFTVGLIREQIPMYEMSIKGLEGAVEELMSKYPRPPAPEPKPEPYRPNRW